MVLVNSQIAIKCQVGNKIDIYFGTLKGFVVKKSHISCMESCYTGLPNKACPRLRDLATAPARGITQPRTNLIREPCSVLDWWKSSQSPRQKIWSTSSHLSMRKHDNLPSVARTEVTGSDDPTPILSSCIAQNETGPHSRHRDPDGKVSKKAGQVPTLI